MVDKNKVDKPGKLNRSGVNRIIQVLVSGLVMAGLLFLLRGRLDWLEAWIFLGIYLLGILANAWWAFSHDVELINERGRMGENAKNWDKVIGLFYTLLLLGLVVVAPLDVRQGWSAVPAWVKGAGALAFCVSMAMTFWVMKTNPFLSSFVRIQQDRGHYTVTSGPYRFVRHPLYAGVLFMGWGIPLLLGSWWALIPGLLIMALLVIRTALEDRTHQAELPGYLEYTHKVRYRLIPGLW